MMFSSIKVAMMAAAQKAFSERDIRYVWRNQHYCP
jgi:hypothetical protein